MENKKMTKRDYFNSLLNIEEVKANSAMTEFIEHELELLSKKNASDRKPTAQQKENEVIKAAIVAGMTENRLYTITEIIKEIPECGELTNQKVSALFRQLASENKVERLEEKKKATSNCSNPKKWGKEISPFPLTRGIKCAIMNYNLKGGF